MTVIDTLRELIDLRSFSNLWFWIALAVTWSTVSHWIIGVPIDMVHRARKHGGQTLQDLEDLARVHVNRRMFIVRMSGVWILGLACFGLSTLAVLGFGFAIEFAQALFLLGFPMSLVSLLSLRTASLIEREEARGEALCKRLIACRLQIQLIGVVSIFVTALWGMYQNLHIGALH